MSKKNKRVLLPLFFAITVIITLVIGIASIKTPDVYAKNSNRFETLDSFSNALSVVEKYYVEEVETEDLIKGAINGMLSELDPHSNYFTPKLYKEFQIDTKGEFGGLGITIGLKDKILTVISPLEDTPAYEAGLKSGDMIIKISGKSTANISLEEAVKKLRGKPKTKVTITIYRKSVTKPFDVTITRDIIKIKAVNKSYKIQDIGYIRLTQFKHESSKQIRSALTKLQDENIKGLILDLRNNPGGLLTEAVKVSNIFLSSNKNVVYTQGRDGKKHNFDTSVLSKHYTDLPMVVLINEGSASASEIVAGALQDHKRAIIIGKTSFGKASVQTILPMADGSAIKLTTARYYTPNGRSIQGVGITPDVEIAQGKIVLNDNNRMLKEKDLDNHLRGEDEIDVDVKKFLVGDNETVTKKSNLPDLSNDLQLKFSIDMLKGFIKYGKK